MCSASGYHRFAVVGFPIRISPDLRLYTATRGFSQCPTSFFGTWHQGILRKLLVASLRDAEISKLLALLLLAPWRCCFLLQQLPYSLVKVLTGIGCLCVVHIFQSAPHIDRQFIETRQPGKPPGWKYPCDFASIHLTCLAVCQNFTASHISCKIRPQ